MPADKFGNRIEETSFSSLESLEDSTEPMVKYTKQTSNDGNIVEINDAMGSASAIKINKTVVTSSGNCIDIDNDGNGVGINLVQDGAAAGVSIDQNNNDNQAISILANRYGQSITVDGIDGGYGLRINAARNTTLGVIDINKTATSTGSCIDINNDGIGDSVTIAQDGNGIAINIAKTNTGNANIIQIANSGSGLDIRGHNGNWLITKDGLISCAGMTGPNLIGATGIQGEVGSQGETGIQGIQGIQGETGPSGLLGSQGVTGISSAKTYIGEWGDWTIYTNQAGVTGICMIKFGPVCCGTIMPYSGSLIAMTTHIRCGAGHIDEGSATLYPTVNEVGCTGLHIIFDANSTSSEAYVTTNPNVFVFSAGDKVCIHADASIDYDGEIEPLSSLYVQFD